MPTHSHLSQAHQGVSIPRVPISRTGAPGASAEKGGREREREGGGSRRTFIDLEGSVRQPWYENGVTGAAVGGSVVSTPAASVDIAQTTITITDGPRMSLQARVECSPMENLAVEILFTR